MAFTITNVSGVTQDLGDQTLGSGASVTTQFLTTRARNLEAAKLLTITHDVSESQPFLAGSTSKTGIYIPRGWGANWRTALSNASTSRATLAVVGDSVSQGFDASDLLATSYVGLLKADLQTRYGDGGSGYLGVPYSRTFMAGGPGATLDTYYAGKGNLDAVTGTWSINSQGISTVLLQTTVNGSTISVTRKGTSIDLYTVDGPATTTWSYQIDGGATVPVTPTNTGVLIKRTLSGLSAGNHTVVITFTGASGTLFFGGAAGYNASGVVVNRFAKYGVTSAAFAVEAFGSQSYSGSYNYPSNLVIYSLGLNDGNAAITGDTWAQNARKYLSSVREGGTATGNTDVMILLQHVGKQDTTNNLYQDYVARARGLAEAYGAALINVWALGNNSWNYFNNLGYWGNGANPAIAGADNVHLSDAGHTFVYNTIAPYITPASPSW
jgi:lysophospholipase L1-like esterase